MIFLEYLLLLAFFCVAIGFSMALCIISSGVDVFLFNVAWTDFEKVSSYECGFQPFSDARNTFDIRFYLVAILFIIFDLEITFLLPWAICFEKIDDLGFWNMYIFLAILTIGFLYEWIREALDWQ